MSFHLNNYEWIIQVHMVIVIMFSKMFTTLSPILYVPLQWDFASPNFSFLWIQNCPVNYFDQQYVLKVILHSIKGQALHDFLEHSFSETSHHTVRKPKTQVQMPKWRKLKLSYNSPNWTLTQKVAPNVGHMDESIFGSSSQSGIW